MFKSSVFRLHFIVFLWGFTAIIGKLIHANAQLLVFYRMLFTAIILFVVLKLFKKQSLKVSKKLLLQLVVVGSFMAFHWLFFFTSIKVSNVSIALSCLALSTLFASLIEPLVFRRKLDWTEVIMGVVIVLCIGLIFEAEFQYKLGIFFGILTALFGAIFSVFNGKLYGKAPTGTIVFYEIFGGGLILSLILFFQGHLSSTQPISWRDLGLIILLAGFFTAYPMFESVRLMNFISPFTLILTVNLEPIYGIILAYFIFNDTEKMTFTFYIASGVMLLAIFIESYIKTKRKKRKEVQNHLHSLVSKDYKLE